MIRRLIPVSLLCLILAGSVALAQSKNESKSQPPAADNSQPLIKLKFAGGNVADYVDAVRKAAGGLNVYVAPEANAMPMPAIELNNVTAAAALGILDRRMMNNAGTSIELRFDRAGATVQGEQPIFSVQAIVAGRPPSQPISNHVWAISGLIAAGVKPEDLLTAIQTSLDLLGDEGPQAQLRFHEPTGVLIARASVEQLNAIEQVVSSVERAVKQRSENAVAAQQKVIQQLQERIEQLESQLGKPKPNAN